MTNAQPGWQPDPTGRHEHRYWDGARWTENVADAGVASSDSSVPAAEPSPPGDAGAAGPGTFDGTVPPGDQGSGGSPAPQPSMSPAGGQTGGLSGGVLIGLGLLVVVGLAIAIVVVLVRDDDSDTTTVSSNDPSEEDDSGGAGSGDDGSDPGDSSTGGGGDSDAGDDGDLAEEDPLGMEPMVDQMVADTQGEIDEADARCMITEGAREGLALGYVGNEAFEDLPSEGRLAIMSAMFDCVDADALMASLMASGMVEGGTLTQSEADCAADAIVETLGADVLLQAIADDPDNPMNSLSTEHRDAMFSAVAGCVV